MYSVSFALKRPLIVIAEEIVIGVLSNMVALPPARRVGEMVTVPPSDTASLKEPGPESFVLVTTAAQRFADDIQIKLKIRDNFNPLLALPIFDVILFFIIIGFNSTY
ncbi:MAG: hypothetical protein A3D92_11405 [Bacteroidetes bacterium RIFCSPHIGHO2_02_FULL_44_7]|nr:MAG: hypothetical protein A3D92_11405 [Bacteroidetes bacterium RIFCSPHIGHO2_02_FULL_44_7]